MTIVEKIIARHSQRKSVNAGETLFVNCDLAMGSEIIFNHINELIAELGAKSRILHDRIALINGHLVSTREAAAGTLVAQMDRFAQQMNIVRYYQAGKSGDCQSLLGVHGLIGPGDFVVGSDQHFTTYGALGAFAAGVGGVDLAMIWTTGETWITVPRSVRIHLSGRLKPAVTAKDLALHILGVLGADKVQGMALEFSGDALEQLGIYDRFMLCNMISETGAMSAVMPVDNISREFLNSSHYAGEISATEADPDAEYEQDFEFDLGNIVPMVATPYMPTLTVSIESLPEIPVDQVVIGSCTSGRIEDFRLVAKLLEKYDIANGVRTGLYPASHQAVRDLVEEDLALFFTRKGASISPPSCQPCLGAGPSLLGENETGVYTTNRNYRGRHGPASSRVFLAGPLAAAASAIAGVITDPREFLLKRG